MPWFYAHAGQKVGPIDEADFERLTREGVIQPTTLVWREGMSGWEPCQNVVAAFSRPPAPSQVTCGECGRAVAEDETLRMGDATICAACKPAYVQKMREGITTEAAPVFRYAGFWIRVPAALIDAVLMFAVSIGLDVATGSTFLQSIGLQESDWATRDWVLLAVDFVLDTTYQVVLVTMCGGTVGKLLCGIRVITADGHRLTYAHSLARALAQYVSLLPCGIGFILAAFDGQKRALHDMICNTRVIWAKTL